MFDDEQLGFLAGDEYRRAAASRDTDERVGTDQQGQTGEPKPDGVGTRDLLADLADLVGGRFEDDDPPGCPAPRCPVA
ncbi:MAG TPA: hypothetical protein VIS06_18965 [Mycobacteriales bacterium]